MKSYLINFLKVAITMALIYWLTTSDKLDFKLVSVIFQKPITYIKVLMAFIIIKILGALRWQLILNKIFNYPLGYIQTFIYSWMGYFFNLVLPGSVSGDLVKMFLIKKKLKDSKIIDLGLSVFLDRITGILGFFIIIGTISLFNYQEISTQTPKALILVHFGLLIFMLSIFSILILFLPQTFFKKLYDLTANVKWKFIIKMSSLAQNHHFAIKKNIFQFIIISIASQLLTIFSIMIIANSFSETPLTIATSFTAIPLGLITLSIPLAPGGFGVGHIAFEKIFQLFSVSNGANIFNIYFISWSIIGLTGSIPYVMSGLKFKNIKLEDENL